MLYLHFLIVKSPCSSLNLMSVGLKILWLWGKSPIFSWSNMIKSDFLDGEMMFNHHFLLAKSPLLGEIPSTAPSARRSQHRRSQDLGVVGLASAGSRGGRLMDFRWENREDFTGKTWRNYGNSGGFMMEKPWDFMIYDGEILVDFYDSMMDCQRSRNLWWTTGGFMLDLSH